MATAEPVDEVPERFPRAALPKKGTNATGSDEDGDQRKTDRRQEWSERFERPREQGHHPEASPEQTPKHACVFDVQVRSQNRGGVRSFRIVRATPYFNRTERAAHAGRGMEGHPVRQSAYMHNTGSVRSAALGSPKRKIRSQRMTLNATSPARSSELRDAHSRAQRPTCPRRASSEARPYRSQG